MLITKEIMIPKFDNEGNIIKYIKDIARGCTEEVASNEEWLIGFHNDRRVGVPLVNSDTSKVKSGFKKF